MQKGERTDVQLVRYAGDQTGEFEFARKIYLTRVLANRK